MTYYLTHLLSYVILLNITNFTDKIKISYKIIIELRTTIAQSLSKIKHFYEIH